MLTFFVTIVLVAEIIITCQIVSFILKIDAKVCALNEQISAISPKIEQNITSIRIAVNKILLGINEFEQKLKSKKEQFKYNFLKNIITIALLLLLNTNAKKIISIIDLGFAIKTLANEWTKKLV